MGKTRRASGASFKSLRGSHKYVPTFGSTALGINLRTGKSTKARTRDIYYFSSTPNAYGISCDASLLAFSMGPCDGYHIGGLLDAIRQESPYTLVGGAYLLQPKLHLTWECVDTYTSFGNAGAQIVQLPFVFRNPISVESVAGSNTNFTADFVSSYDTSPAASTVAPAYQYWPSTDLRENTRFWIGRRPLKPRVGRCSPGHPLVIRSRSRRVCHFDWNDYEFTTFLTTGMLKGRGWRSVTKVTGEVGGICGVADEVNQTIAGGLSTAVVHNRRIKYTYWWTAGGMNQAPSIRGYYYTDEDTGVSQAVQPQTTIGVPALKAFRQGADIFTNSVPGNTMEADMQQSVVINPPSDCVGDAYIPTVIVQP